MDPHQQEIDDWLALALRGALAGPTAAAPSAASPLDPELDRAQFVARLRFHGIAATLAGSLQDLPPAPDWIGEEIARETAMQRIWEEGHRAVLVPLLHELAAAGVAALLMKGTALAYLYYPDPVMRPRGDSDLLVPHGQLDKARDRLKRAGFVCLPRHSAERHQETWQIDSGFGMLHEVDLHWQISPIPALQRVLLTEQFMAEQQDVPALSSDAKAVGKVMTMVHCAVNQAMHAYSGYYLDGRYVAGRERLGWVQDIHLLSASFVGEEWDRLVSVARDRKVAPTVHRALTLARDRLGSVVPSPVLDALARQASPDAITDYLEHASPLRRLTMDLKGARSLRDKLSALHWHLFPSRFRMRIQHPDYPEWPMPLLYLRRLFGAVASLLSGGAHRG